MRWDEKYAGRLTFVFGLMGVVFTFGLVAYYELVSFKAEYYMVWLIDLLALGNAVIAYRICTGQRYSAAKSTTARESVSGIPMEFVDTGYLYYCCRQNLFSGAELGFYLWAYTHFSSPEMRMFLHVCLGLNILMCISNALVSYLAFKQKNPFYFVYPGWYKILEFLASVSVLFAGAVLSLRYLL